VNGVGANAGVQRLFAWSGVAMLAIFLVGFWPVAGFVPPSRPQDSVADIAEFYRANTFRIRLGLWLTMLAAPLCATFFVGLSIQLHRIEGRHSPIAYAQMILGGLFVLEFIFPLMIWQAAAYRPELDPVMTYRLHDLGWLLFVGVVSTAVVQAILIALAILRDDHDDPILPRWIGYRCLWSAIAFMPPGLIVFFKSGMLAWNGVIAWWVLLASFAFWVLLLAYGLLRHAIPHQLRHENAAA
jgi:hypothetical protein